jgi:hypothetical protein
MYLINILYMLLQQGGNFFLSLVTNKGEHSIFCSKETNIDSVERGEKKSNAVKGAISLNR